MSDLDKILRHISTDENFEKDFSIADVQREIFPNKNSDQIEHLLRTIIAHELRIVNVFSEFISPVIMANGLTKEFLDNGGFSKIELDKKTSSDILKIKDNLDLEIKLLQKDKFEYEKTIRAQNDRIRNLEEQIKFISLLKLYWWLIPILISIGIFLKVFWDIIKQG